MAENIKKIHPEYCVFYKGGNFFNAYGKDAYILSYLFGYKIREVKEKIPVAGFPKNALSKIMAKYERKKINYIVIDTRNNYDVDYKEDYKNLNNYTKTLEEAKIEIKYRNRIDRISQELLKQKDIEKIKKIEKIVYEERKI